MKAFRQTIQELSANDKLDKLGHNKPLSGSRLKQLTRDFSAYEDIDLDQWQGYPHPRNSSQVTKNEIHNLISLGQFRDQWERDMIMHDKKVIQAFREYLDKHGLEVDLDRIEKLRKQASPILLSLLVDFAGNCPGNIHLLKSIVNNQLLFLILTDSNLALVIFDVELLRPLPL